MGDNKDGNVVLAYTTYSHLMLDCDLKREDDVKEFAKKYAKFHDLGSAAVFKTSDTPQVDLSGKRLGNYCIIFGRKMELGRNSVARSRGLQTRNGQ